MIRQPEYSTAAALNIRDVCAPLIFSYAGAGVGTDLRCVLGTEDHRLGCAARLSFYMNTFRGASVETTNEVAAAKLSLFLRDLHAMIDIDTLKTLLLQFRDDRNWKQFHTLKNLIISLNLESSELLELTQWKTDEELSSLRSDTRFQEALKDECADVFLYLLLICEEAGVDLLKAAAEKIQKNSMRYTVTESYGSAKKYTELKQAKGQKT